MPGRAHPRRSALQHTSGASALQRTSGRSGRTWAKGGHAFYLHQLARIAEHRHPEQGARWTMRRKTGGNDVPHGDQIVPISNHVDGGLKQVLWPCSESCQDRIQIVECRSGLASGITWRYDIAIRVEGTCTGGEQDRACGCGRSVLIRHAGKEGIRKAGVLVQRLMISHPTILVRRRSHALPEP
jgi:hypothetical protein